MFDNLKSSNKTSSGEIGLNIRKLACLKVVHGQVSRGVHLYMFSVGKLHPLQMLY